MRLTFVFDPWDKQDKYISRLEISLREKLDSLYDKIPEGFTVFTFGKFYPMSKEDFVSTLRDSLNSIFQEVTCTPHEINIELGSMSDADWKKQIAKFKEPFVSLPKTFKGFSKLRIESLYLSGEYISTHDLQFKDVFNKLPKEVVKGLDEITAQLHYLAVDENILVELDRIFEVMNKIRKQPPRPDNIT